MKGFMVIQPLADNTPGAIAQLGELSTYAKTFSKDIGHYSRSAEPDVDLMVFHSQIDDGVQTEIRVAYRDPILELGQWLYTNAIGGFFNGSESEFSSLLLAEFSDRLTDLNVGQMVQEGDTTTWLPQYLDFKVVAPGVDAENFIRLWLSDQAFRAQYDEYTIEVVPPIDALDDFFKTAVEVKALLDQYNDTERMQRIQAVIGDKPPTHQRVELYTWANPIQPDYELTTPWTLVIYGPAGNNIDNIKATLSSYILANSARDRAAWEEFIPDLFKATEFIITPLWANFSIPNETLVKGLYSPTIRHKTVLAIARLTATRYPSAHVDDVVETSVANWRSMGFLAVGGPDNRDAINTLSQKFPDYIAIPTDSGEFGRMSPDTQNWTVLLSNMMRVADDMTEYSDLPIGMSRLERDGVLYLVASHAEFQYLVVSRLAYEDLFGEIDPTVEPVDIVG
jgi:hypothetical protein